MGQALWAGHVRGSPLLALQPRDAWPMRRRIAGFAGAREDAGRCFQRGKGVRNQLPERPFGCFAQLVPDTFSGCASSDTWVAAEQPSHTFTIASGPQTSIVFLATPRELTSAVTCRRGLSQFLFQQTWDCPPAAAAAKTDLLLETIAAVRTRSARLASEK